MVVRELKIRYGDAVADVPQQGVTTPEVLASVFRKFLGDEAQEVFCAILLSSRHQVLGIIEVSRGTLTGSLVHPREVLKPAILLNASALAIAHNHPSGDPSPSREDRAVTERLQSACKIMGISLLDHIIIGSSGRSYSFAESGGLSR